MADWKKLARQIFGETLAAIDIPAAMERKLLREGSLLHCHDAAIALSAFTKFRVVAIGKAAHAMLDGLRSVLPREIAFEGVACAPTPPPQPVQGIDYFAGGHPIPNQQSLQAAKSILALLRDCDEKALVFFLLSGGGSALVELPLASELTLEEGQQLYPALVTSPPPIGQLNAAKTTSSASKSRR